MCNKHRQGKVLGNLTKEQDKIIYNYKAKGEVVFIIYITMSIDTQLHCIQALNAYKGVFILFPEHTTNNHHSTTHCYCKVTGSNVTCRDEWKTRWQLHSEDQTSMELSLPGKDIIHSPVVRVVCGWWALAYKLIRMPESIENLANCAIWQFRGSLNKNTGFSLLSQTSKLFWP